MPSATFAYQPKNPAAGDNTPAPLLPLTIFAGGISLNVVGLVDSGSSTNVLPYDIGAAFGIDWDSLPIEFPLGGAGGMLRAKAIKLWGRVANSPPVELAFGWVRSNDFPLILGQVNFFMEFDVCFHGSRSTFEVEPKP